MGKKKPVKRTTVAVPKSREGLAEFVRQIGDHRRAIDTAQIRLNNQIERLKAQAGEVSRPHEEAIGQLLEGAFVFAAGNREELTEGGKTKTVQLPTGVILWRTTPPSASIRNKEVVIASCESLGLTRFIRVRKEPDKEAMLKEPEVAKTIKGVTITQREEFVVKPSEVDVEISESTKKLQKALPPKKK